MDVVFATGNPALRAMWSWQHESCHGSLHSPNFGDFKVIFHGMGDFYGDMWGKPCFCRAFGAVSRVSQRPQETVALVSVLFVEQPNDPPPPSPRKDSKKLLGGWRCGAVLTFSRWTAEDGCGFCRLPFHRMACCGMFWHVLACWRCVEWDMLVRFMHIVHISRISA